MNVFRIMYQHPAIPNGALILMHIAAPDEETARQAAQSLGLPENLLIDVVDKGPA